VDFLLGANKDIICYNLYAYVSNNPINNTDSNGEFLGEAWKKIQRGYKKFKKNVEDVWNGAKNFATTVYKNVKNFVTNAYNGVCSTINNLGKAFVFEAEVGFGVGFGGQVGLVGGHVGATKTFGYGYSNNQSYEYTSNSIGFDVSVYKYKGGLSADLRNYDDGLVNPMSMPWEIWNDPHTALECTFLMKRVIYESPNSSVDIGPEFSKNGTFWGISLEFCPFVGGKIKIGFNF